ncbi:hypothetical protein Sjap_012296 [Stephania japonica]|uniref:Uncharacterized protein n=1 Tax=Stephania japonica TaxID=461633 RepID=A0AAP0NY49_9MAGN
MMEFEKLGKNQRKTLGKLRTGQRFVVAWGGESGPGNASLGKLPNKTKHGKYCQPKDAAVSSELSGDEDESSVYAGMPSSEASDMAATDSLSSTGFMKNSSSLGDTKFVTLIMGVCGSTDPKVHPKCLKRKLRMVVAIVEETVAVAAAATLAPALAATKRDKND